MLGMNSNHRPTIFKIYLSAKYRCTQAGHACDGARSGSSGVSDGPVFNYYKTMQVGPVNEERRLVCRQLKGNMRGRIGEDHLGHVIRYVWM